MTTKPESILIPPLLFIGELLPWKGKWWKVQLYDTAGGVVELQGETTGKFRAVTENPVIVLEMQEDTAGEQKRRRNAN